MDKRIILAVVIAVVSMSAVLLYFNFMNSKEESKINGARAMTMRFNNIKKGGLFFSILFIRCNTKGRKILKSTIRVFLFSSY